MNAREPEKAKVEEFAGRMVALLNNAMLGLMTSIGHRTGLFDCMAELSPTKKELGMLFLRCSARVG